MIQIPFLKRNNRNYRTALKKFLILSTILTAYFIYLSLKFGATSGVVISFLTWSFFVLCTPIADAGFLLNFPLRFFIGIRMIVSEIFVWIVAVSGNIFILKFYRHYYYKTFLTKLFHKIIVTPYPYWAIIALSAIGTFLSIKFGDNIYDAIAAEKNKKTVRKHFKSQTGVFILIFSIVILIYYHLLKSLGIKIHW